MSTGLSYEDLKLKIEQKETLEAHLVLFHIPDGFAREQVGAKIEYDYGRIRVFGERPLENNKNKIRRFNEVHQVPETCDINRIKGKLEGTIITITMPKKVISKEIPNQIQEATTTAEEESPKPPTQETEPKQKPDKGPQEATPPQSTTTSEDQKGEEGVNSVQDPKPTIQNKDKSDRETETETQPEAKEEIAKDANTSEDAGLRREEELPEPMDEKGETLTKKLETCEQGKQPEKAAEDDDSSKVVKESMELKRKVSSTENDEEKAMPPISKAKRIKEMAASASQGVASFAKRFNEEDKQKLLYVGAAVLVVAVGVYASYKFRSSLRH